MKRPLKTLERAVLGVMNKPKTPAEIRQAVGLSRSSNLSSTLRALIYLRLVHCLNPRVRVGKLYGLTKKGIAVRKKTCYQEYHQPGNIDWNLYGWIACGKQRRAILKAMRTDISLPLKTIKERAQKYNPMVSRTNANDILQAFVKKGIAGKIKQGNRVFFILAKIGESVKKQFARL